jgi:hypothetical protein
MPEKDLRLTVAEFQVGDHYVGRGRIANVESVLGANTSDRHPYLVEFEEGENRKVVFANDATKWHIVREIPNKVSIDSIFFKDAYELHRDVGDKAGERVVIKSLSRVDGVNDITRIVKVQDIYDALAELGYEDES